MKWYFFGRQLALVFLIIVELAAPRASRAQALGPTLMADQAQAFNSLAMPGSGSIQDATIFVAKLSAASGSWQWARRNDRFNGSAERLATDAAGSVYLALRFGYQAQFGSFLLQSRGSSYEVGVVKLNSVGAWQWATSTQCSYYATDYLSALQVGAQAEVYLTGYFTGDTLRIGTKKLVNTVYGSSAESFVAKLNATTGQWRWAVQTRGTGDEYLDGVLPDGAGHLYVGGSFREAGSGPQFGSTTLYSAGGYDVVVAQLDTAGAWQ